MDPEEEDKQKYFMAAKYGGRGRGGAEQWITRILNLVLKP